LQQLIEQTHINRKRTHKWDYSPREIKRNSDGYVGLKNMGCTCYMNSLIQQVVKRKRNEWKREIKRNEGKKKQK